VKRFHDWWTRFRASKETLLLRAENQRLQETCLVLEEENAALRKDLRSAVNNLLAEAGAVPLPSDENIKTGERKVIHRRPSWQQRQRDYVRETTPLIPAKKEN
jgi:hypothetical protein